MPKHPVRFPMQKRLSQRAVNRRELRQARKTQVAQTRMRRNGKLKGEFKAVVTAALLLGVVVVRVALLLGVTVLSVALLLVFVGALLHLYPGGSTTED